MSESGQFWQVPWPTGEDAEEVDAGRDLRCQFSEEGKVGVVMPSPLRGSYGQYQVHMAYPETGGRRQGWDLSAEGKATSSCAVPASEVLQPHTCLQGCSSALCLRGRELDHRSLRSLSVPFF